MTYKLFLPIAIFTLLLQSGYALAMVPDLPEPSFDNAPTITQDDYSNIIAQSAKSVPTDQYIIELEEMPIIPVQKELIENAKKVEETIQNASVFNPIRYYLMAFGLKESDVNDKVEKQKNEIQTEQDKILKKIERALKKTSSELNVGHEGTAPAKYFKIFNGFTLKVSANEVEKLQKISGIKSITPDTIYTIALSDSIPIIHADDTWQMDKYGNECSTSGNPCITGEGITIGILDTGVDYTHPDLGGCKGPQCKVIDGYNFIEPGQDFMDDNGHGTHVASTAAGNGTMQGVAPDAKIVAYKVCNAGGSCQSSHIIAAIERSVDPNGDGDFSDHLDVINLSLGGAGSPDDPGSTAINNAVAAGVTAVVAAGNSGPNISTIGCPGCAKDALTVGASSNNVGRTSSLLINNNIVASSAFLYSKIGSANSILKAVSGVGTKQDFAASGNFTGTVALIARGTIPFYQKVENAFLSGAIGVIIYNTDDKPLVGTLNMESAIPAIGISYSEGQRLLDMFPGNISVRIDVSFNSSMPDQIADFSSRGPVLWGTNVLQKPDIVAPGAHICAARLNGAYEDRKCGDRYANISGTSMATPHVAGVAALLLQARPEWTPLDVKNALKISATDIHIDPRAQGNGRVNVPNALRIPGKPLFLEITSGTFDSQNKQIIGSITGSNLNRYTILVKKQSDPDSAFTEICNGTNNVDNGTICTWETIDQYSQGQYILKTEVEMTYGTFINYSVVEIVKVRISYPPNLLSPLANQVIEPITSTDTIDIIGSIDASNFDYYTLNLERVPADGIDYSSAIEEYHGGKDRIQNNLIGTITTSKLPSAGRFVITLRVNYKDNKSDVIYSQFYYETRFANEINAKLDEYIPSPDGGWNTYYGSFNIYEGQPSFIDMDGDGDLEMVDAYGTHVRIINHDGTYLEGWPYIFDKNDNVFLTDDPIIGDFDNDGENELIVPGKSGYQGFFYYYFETDGSRMNDNKIPWQYRTLFYPNSVAIEDINGDGTNEIVGVMNDVSNKAGEKTISIHVFNSNFEELEGWPKSFVLEANNVINVSTAIGDVNGDGKKEIVVNTFTQYFENNSDIRVYSYDGNLLSGWPKKGRFKDHSLFVADVDADGIDDILVSESEYNVANIPFETRKHTLHVWNGNGDPLHGWPVYIDTKNTSNAEFGMQVAGNIDEDPELEVIINSRDAIYVFSYNGILESGFPVKNSVMATDIILLADVDNDGLQEMILASGTQILLPGYVSNIEVFNNDGSKAENASLRFPGLINGTAAITDMNFDGKKELFLRTNNYRLTAYELDYSAGPISIGEYHYTPEHTSKYTSVSTSCSDECLNNGDKQCSDNLLQTCGNFDYDQCLEWSRGFVCEYGCDTSSLTCETCNPQCDGKQCGDDGCGGICPPGCGNDEICIEDWTCSALCGNGYWELREICEDGNNIDNDGCSSACQIDGNIFSKQVKFFVDPAFKNELSDEEIRNNLSGYIDDINTVLAKNTNRQLLFNPSTDVIFTQNTPHRQSANCTMSNDNFGYAFYIQKNASNVVSFARYPILCNQNMTFMSPVEFKWKTFYSREDIGSENDINIEYLQKQFYAITKSIANMNGIDTYNTYNSINSTQDITNVEPDLSLFTSRYPTYFLSHERAKNGFMWKSRSSVNSISDIEFAPLSATIISKIARGDVNNECFAKGFWSRDCEIQLPKYSTENPSISVAAIDENTGNTIPNCQIQIYDTFNLISGTISYVKPSANENNTFTFQWDNPHDSISPFDIYDDQLRLIKIQCPGYKAGGEWISILDLLAGRLVIGGGAEGDFRYTGILHIPLKSDGTVIPCTDECSVDGDAECVSSDSLRTCGNYDSDTCLEWDEEVCAHGCENSECVTCIPDCDNASCGDDGCGGSCPPGCSINEECSLDRQCVIICENECASIGEHVCDDEQTSKVCGNFDNDSCLEWQSSICELGCNTESGECKTCADECPTAGAKSCESNTVMICAADGDGDTCLEWKNEQSCTAKEQCENGACITVCTDECTDDGSYSCKDNIISRICGNFDSDACLEYAETECQFGCNNTSGQCKTCADECPTAGAKSCESNTVMICAADGDGDTCLEWKNEQSCTAKEQCENGACITVCTDECTTNDPPECVNENTSKICANFDKDACMEWGNQTCEFGCQSSTGMCKRKPDPLPLKISSLRDIRLSGLTNDEPSFRCLNVNIQSEEYIFGHYQSSDRFYPFYTPGTLQNVYLEFRKGINSDCNEKINILPGDYLRLILDNQSVFTVYLPGAEDIPKNTPLRLYIDDKGSTYYDAELLNPAQLKP